MAARVKVVDGRDRLSSRPDCAVEASVGVIRLTVATSSITAPRIITRLALGSVSSLSIV